MKKQEISKDNKTKKVFDKVSQYAKSLKGKYNQMTPDEKKKMAGIAGGVLAVLASISVAKKLKGRRKKENTE